MSKVYVAAPLGERTAGPEAATQFVDALRRRDIEAFLIPMRNFRGRRNDPEYDIYDYAVAEQIPDPENAILVIPEVSPIESWRELRQVPRERTWLGWFSVTNSPDPRARYFRPSEECCSIFPPGFITDQRPQPASYGLGTAITDGGFRTWREARRRTTEKGLRGLAATAVDSVSITYAERIINDPRISFFAQSYFAQGFVRQILNREAMIITDPIRPIEIPSVPRRRNVVAYNYVKSWSLIGEVAALLPDVEFLPIKNMSYAQVMETLRSASMYLELGHLPGRDRMTREASFLGTPVAVLARGAGYCWQDFPLHPEFRIAFREGWAVNAKDVVTRILADPAQAALQQLDYRAWVMGERERYEQAIDGWVNKAFG